MPIQIKAPDGSIAQFPDGMSDDAISAVMAKHYPQPSMMDKIAASPVGRFAHDAIAAPIMGLGSMLSSIDPTMLPQMKQAPQLLEKPYQAALAANRNTPGYAAARASADTRTKAMGGGGFTDQILAPYLPSLVGAMGAPGGFDAMNANADSQTAAQDTFSNAGPFHKAESFVAGLIGGAMAVPSGVPALNAAAISGSVSPADAATAYVRRLGADPTKLNAAQISAGGKPITAAEAIGKPGQVAVGALARREGATPDALAGLIGVRNASAPQRILSDYASASGINPLAARGDIEGFIEANQKAAAPLYREAEKANPNIASPMLDKILETPAGKQAMASARTKMQNDMSLMGTPDAELMDQAREGGTDLPSRGAASGMKLRVYDYIKKSLDDQISAAYRAGNNHEAGIIKDLKNKMVSELDKADVTAAAGPNSLKPEGGLYAQARAKAGEYLGAKKQFEAGQDHILDNNLPAKDFAAYYSKLGPADQQAYLGGVANKLFNLQQTNKLKAAVFKAPIIQAKLATVMGPQKAASFIGNMGTEEAMANFARQRVPGAGSPTAEYAQAMKDQDAVSGLGMGALQVGSDAISQGLPRAIGNLVMNKGKDAAASWMTRGMAIPVRDEAGRLLMLPPKDLAAHLSKAGPALPTAALHLPQLTAQSRLPLGLFGSGLLTQQPSMSGR